MSFHEPIGHQRRHPPPSLLEGILALLKGKPKEKRMSINDEQLVDLVRRFNDAGFRAKQTLAMIMVSCDYDYAEIISLIDKLKAAKQRINRVAPGALIDA